jgi:hypothetical protein
VVKQQEREADHSPPCSVEAKNSGATPLLHYTSSWRGAIGGRSAIQEIARPVCNPVGSM